jgi:hypothetical protein
MKSIIVVLLIISIIFIAVGYIKSNQKCPPPIVEFRYIPRTFKEEQNVTTPILSQFGKLFNEPSAWIKNNGFIRNNVDARSLFSSNKN